MSVLNRDEFFNRLHDRVGADTSDEALQFIEDMSDTYNAMEQSTNGDGDTWKRKYEELDAAWKEKYKRRFFTGGGAVPMGVPAQMEADDASEITIDQLFK